MLAAGAVSSTLDFILTTGPIIMQNRVEQNRAEQSKPNPLLYLWGIIFLFFAVNQFTQFLTSPTADLDQSEQLVLSQSYQLGYGPQPPLYTYIVNIAFTLSGPSLAVLLGIKVLLLSILAGTFIRIGTKLNFSLRQQLISVSGIAFIPQLIWESQRDLTHSVLATVIAAITLLQIIRTFENKTKANYFVLGVLIGLGLISKYNYSLILTAFLVSMFIIQQYKKILCNKYIILTIVAAMLITAPHIVWAVSNMEMASSSAHKMQAGTGNVLSGLAKAALSAIAFISPLWIFALIFLPKPPKLAIATIAQSDTARFLFVLLVTTLTIVAAFVIITGAQAVKDRWYQPLLFYVPLLAAIIAKTSSSKTSNYYIGLAITIAVIMAVILPIRTIFAASFNKFSRPNMPYSSVYQSILAATGNPDFILAETNLLGGNARLIFSQVPILTSAYHKQAKPFSGKGIIVCETSCCKDKNMQDWLIRNYAIDVKSLSFHKVESPFFYAPQKKMTVYWAEVFVSLKSEQ